MKLTPFINHRPEIVIDTEKSSLLNRVMRWDDTHERDVTVVPDRDRRHGNGRDQGKGVRDEAIGHLDNLRRTAATVNRDLSDRNSPYRFYVFSEDGEVFVNLVLLNPDGSVAQVKRTAKTHAEFSDLVRQLERGEGLLLELVG